MKVMNKQEYINKIVKNIQCSGKKKKDLKKQLLSDIENDLAAGFSFEEIVEKIGTPEEVVEAFEQNISAEEKKKYKLCKIAKIAAVAVAIIAVVVVFGVKIYKDTHWKYDITKDGKFEAAVVEDKAKYIVKLINTPKEEIDREKVMADYPDVDPDQFDGIRDYIAKYDAGEYKWFGNTKLWAGIDEVGKYCGVAEVEVVYENKSFVISVSFRENMELWGIGATVSR